MTSTTMQANLATAYTQTNLNETYKDNFYFSSGSEDAFLEAMNLLGANRRAESIKVKEMVFKAMPHSMDSYTMASLQLESAFREDGEEFIGATLDSIESGTKVYVERNGVPFMLRNTALASICERLRIGGDALAVIPAEMLAQHLNDYAAYTDNEGLAIWNNGKLEVVLGQKYHLVPAELVLAAAAEYFASTGKPAQFICGHYTHSYADALWKTGECKLEGIFDVGLGGILFEQSVVVSTSDCGCKAITIAPKMRRMDDEYGLQYCMPLKQEHDGNASVEAFEKMLKLVDKSFEDANERIAKMAETSLDYPVNVLLCMLKWLRIPAKYGTVVYENRKVMWAEKEKTAYDVYASLSEVLSLIMGEEKTTKTLAEYQERFARALRFPFTDYDLPGEYGYNDKLIGEKGV